MKVLSSIILLCLSASAVNAKPLKKVYDRDFLIGSAIGSRGTEKIDIYPMRQDPEELELLAREFNSVTPENLMKWMYIHPQPGSFNFEPADELVEFAEENGQDVVGHALVWHAQIPDWVFMDEQGEAVSRDVLIERMREHIHAVVGRYKGRIKYWDVVNEAVVSKMVEDDSLPPDEEGNPQMKRIVFYRDTPWRKIIGDDYIEMAFRFAHEADPDARLIYNDYSMIFIEKAQFVADMVEELKKKGTPIHEVGMQGHWNLEGPTPEDLEAAIDTLVDADVKVSVTELDISILPLAYEHQGADLTTNIALRAELNPYTNGVPDEVLEQQEQRYKEIFSVLLRNRRDVERVTFWGVSDKYTWLNTWPVDGRTDAPLLFDRNFKPKPAYDVLK